MIKSPHFSLPYFFVPFLQFMDEKRKILVRDHVRVVMELAGVEF